MIKMIKILLLLILTTPSVAIVIEEINFNYSQLNQNTLTTNQAPNKGMLTGEGKISGLLSEIGTNNSIANNAFLLINLSGRENPQDEWSFVDTINVIDSVYEFTNLTDGEYFLSVFSHFDLNQEDRPLYLPTLWSIDGDLDTNTFELKDKFIINIENGEAKSNIDFRLTAAGMLIVTNDNSDGLDLRDAFIIDENNSIIQAVPNIFNFGSINGFETIKVLVTFLPVGSYRFYVDSDNSTYYQSGEKPTDLIYGYGECYNCRAELLTGKGSEINIHRFEKKEIDVELSLGASISGKVNFEDDNVNGFISVFDSHGNFMTSSSICHRFNDSCPEENTYHISGLAQGEYYLLFTGGQSIRTLFGGITCFLFLCELTNATPIRLESKQHLDGVNITLQNAVKISGFILDSQTQEGLINDKTLLFGSVSNLIEVYDENQSLKAIGVDVGNSGFSVSGQLKPGKYFLRTGSKYLGKSNVNYVNQALDGISCNGNNCDFNNAQLLDLTELNSIGDIRIELERAFSISGTILNDNEEPIKNLEVAVLNQDGLLISNTKTKYDGSYLLGGLKPGDYYIRTFNGDKKNNKYLREEIIAVTSSWVNQIYPDSICINDECPFELAELITIQANNILDVNFELSKGNSINGQVKDHFAGTGIPDIEVKLFTQRGEYIESYFTNQEGKYSTATVAPGFYKLVTANSMHYVNQVYAGNNCGLDECDQQLSAIVNVVEQGVTGIDFDLIKGQDFFPELSGLWFNPDQSGHGLQLEVLKSNGTAVLFASWYVMMDGQPMWLTGTGILNKEMAFVNMFISSGAEFPPAFNTSDVQLIPWGVIKFKFNDLNNATITWETDINGFNNGELDIQRLTSLSHAKKDGLSIDACLSGTYFNPEQNGHGIMLEVLGENADSVVLTWFVYYQGQQFWLLATGPINGGEASLSTIYTQGTDFPPNFDSSQLQTIQWGNIELKKIDDNNIKLEWMPNASQSGFNNGNINMQRLTRIEGLDCE